MNHWDGPNLRIVTLPPGINVNHLASNALNILAVVSKQKSIAEQLSKRRQKCSLSRHDLVVDPTMIGAGI